MVGMEIAGARRVMETTSHETANQYLRFGWSLINQYVVEGSADEPRVVKYVLASVRRLEDTRKLITLQDAEEVNAYLAIGWKLIDKHVTAAQESERRDEKLHFVLAWQSEDPPAQPGMTSSIAEALNVVPEIDVEL
jgi:hypothetical protein